MHAYGYIAVEELVLVLVYIPTMHYRAHTYVCLSPMTPVIGEALLCADILSTCKPFLPHLNCPLNVKTMLVWRQSCPLKTGTSVFPRAATPTEWRGIAFEV